MTDTQKTRLRNGAILLLVLSLGITVGVTFFNDKGDMRINRLITQALRYTRLGDYERGLNKLDDAEMLKPSEEQQEIINELREILIAIKNSPESKDLFQNQLSKLNKKLGKLSGEEDIGKNDDSLKSKELLEKEAQKAAEAERLAKEKERLAKLKEEEAKAKEALAQEKKLAAEMKKRQAEIDKLKKALDKEKSKKDAEAQLAQLKAMEAEKKKLQEERALAEKLRKEQEEKLRKEQEAAEKERKAEEEKRKAEEAKRKAQEAEKNQFKNKIAQGKKLLAEEKYVDALDNFNDAEKMDGEDANLKALKGLTLLRLGQEAKANDYFDDSLRRNPDESLAHTGMGEIEYNKKNDDAAQRFYTRALRGQNTALAYYRLGVIELIRRNNEKALDYFQKAYSAPDLNELEKNIKVRLYYNMGKSYERLKDNSKAVGFYKKALSVDKEHENSLIALGQLTYDARSYRESITHLNSAFKLNSTNFFTLFLLGKNYDNLEDYRNAVYYYELAKRVRPESDEVLYNLGRALTFQKKYDEAIVNLKKAYSASPKSETLIQLGIAYIGKKDFSLAESSFKTALEKNSKDSDAYKGLAMSSFEQKNYEKTISILRQAVDINDKDPELWSKLGEVLFIQKQYDEALVSYEQSYRLAPSKQIKYNLAGAYLAAGKLDESERMYENVLSEDPKYAEAHEGLADVDIARKKFAEAKGRLEKLLNLFSAYKYQKRVREKISQLEGVLKNQ